MHCGSYFTRGGGARTYGVDFAFLLADDGAGAEQIVAESVWAADGQSATDLGISGEREELLEIVLRKVSDRDLLEISKIITWYSVAPYLFDDARDVIRGIDRDGSNEAEKGRMLMDRWERKVSEPTYDAVIRAMLKAGKTEEANEVMNLVLNGAPKSTFDDVLTLFTDTLLTSTDHHWFEEAVRNIVKTKCSDEHLRDIAAFISWDTVGPYLPEITRLDIKDIDRSGKDNQAVKRQRLVDSFEGINGANATYEALITAMLDAGERREAERVVSLIWPAKNLDTITSRELHAPPLFAELPVNRGNNPPDDDDDDDKHPNPTPNPNPNPGQDDDSDKPKRETVFYGIWIFIVSVAFIIFGTLHVIVVIVFVVISHCVIVMLSVGLCSALYDAYKMGNNV